MPDHVAHRLCDGVQLLGPADVAGDFEDEDHAIAVPRFLCKGGGGLDRAGAAANGGVLYVLRRDVSASEDDQVVLARDDEQFVIVEEAEIAGPDEYSFLAPDRLPEAFRRCLWPFPETRAHAGTGDPDLADLARPQDFARIPRHDPHRMVGNADPAADERLGGHGGIRGRDGRSFAQPVPRVGADGRRAPTACAADHKGRFREPIAWEPGFGLKAVRREFPRELLQRGGAHRLGTVIGRAPAAQIDAAELFRVDGASAEIIGEIGSARPDRLIAADRREPARGLLNEGAGRHEGELAAEYGGGDDVAEQSHIVMDRKPGNQPRRVRVRRRQLLGQNIRVGIGMGDDDALGRACRT